MHQARIRQNGAALEGRHRFFMLRKSKSGAWRLPCPACIRLDFGT
ncbi:hypothetical protein BACCAP_03660 [Pseudoflavonifractor capillosus ATCC 29799]|uniref:Uncharacterized protein n=1 Tax=Pseudoflavonifractor capillosus ATCC 29799 TaxID=411467 RepID=A6NZK9_9FIRM|nr:hypothetical protein BACCAP_03660 [Pseudoflavonifractor capillosus ATCC 29799]